MTLHVAKHVCLACFILNNVLISAVRDSSDRTFFLGVDENGNAMVGDDWDEIAGDDAPRVASEVFHANASIQPAALANISSNPVAAPAPALDPSLSRDSLAANSSAAVPAWAQQASLAPSPAPSALSQLTPAINVKPTGLDQMSQSSRPSHHSQPSQRTQGKVADSGQKSTGGRPSPHGESVAKFYVKEMMLRNYHQMLLLLLVSLAAFSCGYMYAPVVQSSAQTQEPEEQTQNSQQWRMGTSLALLPVFMLSNSWMSIFDTVGRVYTHRKNYLQISMYTLVFSSKMIAVAFCAGYLVRKAAKTENVMELFNARKLTKYSIPALFFVLYEVFRLMALGNANPTSVNVYLVTNVVPLAFARMIIFGRMYSWQSWASIITLAVAAAVFMANGMRFQLDIGAFRYILPAMFFSVAGNVAGEYILTKDYVGVILQNGWCLLTELVCTILTGTVVSLMSNDGFVYDGRFTPFHDFDWTVWILAAGLGAHSIIKTITVKIHGALTKQVAAVVSMICPLWIVMLLMGTEELNSSAKSLFAFAILVSAIWFAYFEYLAMLDALEPIPPLPEHVRPQG